MPPDRMARAEAVRDVWPCNAGRERRPPSRGSPDARFPHCAQDMGNRLHRHPTDSVPRRSATRSARQRGASILSTRHSHAVS